MEPLHKKQFRAFWPIVIIVVLSSIVGGLIVWVAFNSSLSDDISSMVMTRHKVSRTTEQQKILDGDSSNK